MRDQMENSVAHSQIFVAKCNHLVEVWSPELHFLKSYCYEPYPFYGTFILRLTGVVSGVATQYVSVSVSPSLYHRGLELMLVTLAWIILPS